MKKLLTILLTLSMLIGLVPAFASSAAEAPAITLDGNLSDWEDVASVQIVGSGNFEGKKATWYAVLTDDGLYLACDAYHNKFVNNGPSWHESTNFEVFVGIDPQQQYWVSAQGADGVKAYGAKHEKVTDAIMVNTALSGQATAQHTVTEMFIANDQLPADAIMADGSIRVGMAWKTIGDDCNNGGTNANGDNWWSAPGTYPNGSNKAVVNASGIYTKADYNEKFGGITATYYKAPTVNYKDTIGEDDRSARVSFDGNEKFDASIDALLNGSMVMSSSKVTDVKAGNADWYIYKWTGTMTAKEAGTYTLIGRKIDNGFVMFVNGQKVYEYWGASHWFDGSGDRLVSNDNSFTLAANETANVEIYFLELDGGDALEIFATTTPGDTNSGKNINEAFTFDLTRTHYSTDKAKWINDLVGRGNGENGGLCEEINFKFDSSINALKESLKKGETKKVSSFDNALIGDDAYIIEYSGWLVPLESGAYKFGAKKVDNGFMLEIGGKRAYEFWAGYSWNDNTGNTYPESIELEAGKAYPFTAYFLETNGGEALTLNYTVNGKTTALNCGFTFHAEDPTPPEPCKHPNTELKGKTDATASTEGHTGNLVCKDCGVVVEAGQVIPALGAAERKIDGNLSDWSGVHTLSIVGTDEADGKKVTFYAFLGEDGLYLAADAYHEKFTTGQNDWWKNTNFEFFVNKNGNGDNQCWVSAGNYSAANPTPRKSHDKMIATMTNEKVGNLYHTTVEVFMAYSDFGFLSTGNDDFLRIGIAWKTEGDKINNGEAAGGGLDEYWVPQLTWPNNNDKAVVTANGIFNRNGENLTNTEVVGKKDATDTVDGYTGDTVCKDCGAVIEQGKVIPAANKPAQTGDNTVYAVVAAVAVLSLGVAIVSKKRRIAE